MPTIQHLLETRFSALPGFDSAWLAERLELLRQFALPAVAAQTTDAFTWLVFCHDTTEAEVLEQLRAEQARVPQLRVVTVNAKRTRIAAVRDAVRPDADVLITTRLDTDDAIADEYLAATQAYAPSFYRSPHEQLVVNFPRGYRLDTREGRGRLYHGYMPNSAFHSLLERPRHGVPRGVMNTGHDVLRRRYAGYQRLPMPPKHNGEGHALLHQHYPTHQDESLRAWLMAIHGGNWLSRIPKAAREQPAGARPVGFTLGEGVFLR